MNKQINKYDYLLKIHHCSTCVFFIHLLCFLMFILFYFSFIRLHVCAFAIHFMVYCGAFVIVGVLVTRAIYTQGQLLL